MTTGYQIYKFDPKHDKAFVNAGLHNWRPTHKEAVARKEALERTWSKHGVQYIIIDCAGRQI